MLSSHDSNSDALENGHLEIAMFDVDFDEDSGFRIQDSGFRIQDSGFRIQDSGFRIQDFDWIEIYSVALAESSDATSNCRALVV
jgi:hypothetical protein